MCPSLLGRIVSGKGKSRPRRIAIIRSTTFVSSQPAPGIGALLILRAALQAILAAFLVFALNTAARAQAPSSGEYRIKAEYLANFAKFVEWPDGAFAGEDKPFVIGVVGTYLFGTSLSEAVSGKTVHGRKIKIRILTAKDDLRDCQILFIGVSDPNRLTQILTSLQGANVLTVGETDGFLQAGGAINFLVEHERVRFEVNLSGAARARLKMSSQLLGMARTVWSDASAPKS